MSRKLGAWRRVGLFAGVVALMATGLSGLASAAEEEGSKNLSVPAVYIGTGGPALHSACGAVVSPTGETSTFPDDFLEPLTGVASGEYYVQGEDVWQAECTTADAGLLVTPTWGDNLTGAPLKVGTPIRVELGLLADTAVYQMTGFEVVKLTDELDRYATYGTMGYPVTNPFGEVRVWAADATYSIYHQNTNTYVVPETAFSAEINSTGRIVYGAQFTAEKEGLYTITFESPKVDVATVGVHTTSIEILVSKAGGGGGGRPDNPGGGGGGRPDNPGGGGGGGPKGPRS